MEWFRNLRIMYIFILFGIFESLMLILTGVVGFISRNLTDFDAGIVLFIFIHFLVIMTLILFVTLGSIIRYSYSEIINKMKSLVNKGFTSEYVPLEIEYDTENGELSKSFNSMMLGLTNLVQREEFLRQIMISSLCSLNVEDIFRNIITNTGRLFKADRCFFIEYDAKNDENKPIQDFEVYLSSINVSDITGIKFKKEEIEPYKKILFRQKRPLVVNDINKINLPDIARNRLEEYSVKSFMAVPVFYGSNILGAMTVQYTENYKKFSQDEVELFSTISNQAAIIVQQAKLYECVKEASNREKLLRQIILASVSSFEVKDVLKSIVSETGKLFKSDRCFFVRYNIADKIFQTKLEGYQEYLKSPELKKVSDRVFTTDELSPLAEEIINNRKILVVNDTNNFVFPELTNKMIREFEIKSYVAVPVFYGDTPLGVLVLHYTKMYKSFSEDEIDLLTSIANQSAITIHQAQLFSDIQESRYRELFLRNIVTTIRSSLDLNEVLNVISQEILKHFKVDRVAIWNFEKDSNYTKWASIRESKSAPDIIGVLDFDYPAELKQYLGKRVLETYQDLILDDIEHSDCPHYFINTYKFMKAKSLVVLPVKKNGDRWGLLFLSQVNNYRHWTNSEIDLLHVISDQIYIAIRQAELYLKSQKESQRNKLLADIISAISSSLNFEEVEKIVVQRIGKTLKADRCFINPYDTDTGTYLPVTSEYRSSDNVKSMVGYLTHKDSPEFLKLSLEGREIVGKDTDRFIEENNLQNTGSEKYIRYYDVKSGFSIPIYFGNKLLGSLVVHYSRKNAFNDEELDFVRTITGQLGIALYQAKLYNSAKSYADREALLRKVTEAIRSSLDIDETLTFICDEVARLYNVKRAAISEFYDKDDRSKFIPRREYKESESIKGLKDVPYPRETGAYIGETVLDKGIDLVIDNVTESSVPDYFKKTYELMGVKSILCTSVKKGEDRWGTIILAEYDHYRHWTEEEINLLKNIADQIYIAIRQAELYTSTKNYADREQLLRAINNTLLTSKGIDEALNNMTGEIGRLIDIDRVCITLYDPVLKVFTNVIGEYRCSPDIPSTFGINISTKEFNDFMYSALYKRKDFLVIDNVETTDMPQEIRDILDSISIKSFVIAPIIYQDNLLGLISLSNTREARPIKKQDIELLNIIIQQVAIGINQFQITDKLEKSFESEKAIRDLLMEARVLTDHEQIFNYLLEKLAYIFNVDRTLHLHYDRDGNLYIKNEFLKNKDLKAMFHQAILCSEDTFELEPKAFSNVVIINDVDREIKNKNLLDFLKNKNIGAFLIYPLAKRTADQKRVCATCMLCSTNPRTWASSEIDTLKLALDTISVVYFEIQQKKEAENIRNTFIAMLTHDLRSPINGEQKALEFILSRKDEVQLGNFRELLEDIYKTNEDLLRIVNNLVTVYHYESGKIELNLQPTKIQNLIYDSIRSMKPLAADQESEITTNIDQNIPEISVDKDEISRVMINLISNAIKHTRKGTSINISAQKTDNEVKVAVSDNGQGIPESERQKIFQRYPTTKRKIGTGLGLYLSKQIIDAHKGKIWFETEEGKGTTFYFTLSF